MHIRVDKVQVNPVKQVKHARLIKWRLMVPETEKAPRIWLVRIDTNLSADIFSAQWRAYSNLALAGAPSLRQNQTKFLKYKVIKEPTPVAGTQ